ADRCSLSGHQPRCYKDCQHFRLFCPRWSCSMNRYLGFEESLESSPDREPHRTSYLGWQPSRIRVPFQLRTLSTLLEELPPWLLSARHSGSALSPDAFSLLRIPMPSKHICRLRFVSFIYYYPCSSPSQFSLASLSPDPRSSL
ncbi:hypothetical protein CHARACLAT_022733, partial [Characodon lateralis]|nr:hypothetical protein [Characodon lateralis]